MEELKFSLKEILDICKEYDNQYPFMHPNPKMERSGYTIGWWILGNCEVRDLLTVKQQVIADAYFRSKYEKDS